MRAIVAARREAITWRRTYRADTPQAYWSYLRRYPRGPHAADARRRLAILTAPLEPPPAFAMIDYDVPPPPPDEIVYVDRPVLAFSDPEFDFAPPPPPPVYFLPPPPPDFVVLAPPPPPIGAVHPAAAAVRADSGLCPARPSMSAPPPNNIIYTNIHNTTVINNVINRPPPPQPGPASAGAGRSAGRRGSPMRPSRAGAGRCHARRCRRRSRNGDADPAGQSAGAAERLDKSRRASRPCRAGHRERRRPAFSRPMRRSGRHQAQPLPRANALPGRRGAKGSPPWASPQRAAEGERAAGAGAGVRRRRPAWTGRQRGQSECEGHDASPQAGTRPTARTGAPRSRWTDAMCLPVRRHAEASGVAGRLGATVTAGSDVAALPPPPPSGGGKPPPGGDLRLPNRHPALQPAVRRRQPPRIAPPLLRRRRG